MALTRIVLVFFGAAVVCSAAAAQQCDCQQIVGTCQGMVEVVRSFGKAPSFGAELMVHSSEKRCSKVEYYIDGTPYQTVLVNRQKEPESTFGTKPISAANISFSRCVVCTDTSKQAQGGGTQAGGSGGSTPTAARFEVSGEWRGTLSGQNAGPMTVRLAEADGSLSGEMLMGGKTFQIASGSISGDSISWIQPFIMGNVTWSGSLDRQAGTIRGRWNHPFNSDVFELTKAR